MKPRALANPDFLLLGFYFDLLSQSALGQHGCQELTIEHAGVRGVVRSLALEGDNMAAMAVELRVGQRIFGHGSYPARLFAAKRPESARMLPRVPFETTDRLCITVRLMGLRGGWLHGALCVEREPLMRQEEPSSPRRTNTGTGVDYAPPNVWEAEQRSDYRRLKHARAELREKAHKLGLHIEED